MSSLLERMVQRTRTPLRSMEPLVLARYAPERTANQQSWMESEDAAGLTTGERQIPTLGPPEARSGFEPLHGEDIRPLAEIEISAPQEALSGREFLPPRQSNPERPFRSSEAEATQKPQPVPACRASNDRESGTSMLLPSLETPAAFGPAHSSSSENKVYPLYSAHAPVAHSEKAAHEPATAASPAQAAGNRQYSASLRRQNQSSFQMESSGENAVSEVTISIGHIEIRAEQPTPRSKPAAFRPRVSLTYFLNQRKEKRP